MDDGTLPGQLDAIFDQSNAVVVVVRIEKGATENDTLANVLGGVDPQTGAYTGVHALLAAKSVVGIKPRILAVPGFTHTHEKRDTELLANPVVSELLGIADKLRAVIIKDGPNSNDDAAKSTAALTGSKRVYVVDPALLVQSGDAIVTRYASGAVAGAIARSDNERGWWVSPSNLELNGVVGTARAIDFGLSDATSRANLLNQANVATVIREGASASGATAPPAPIRSGSSCAWCAPPTSLPTASRLRICGLSTAASARPTSMTCARASMPSCAACRPRARFSAAIAGSTPN